MGEQTVLHTFPSSRREALAMLYLENQDLKGKTPEEIQSLYFGAYEALKKDDKERSNANLIKKSQASW